MRREVVNAECVEAMRGLEEASVDAIVTDPPYDLLAGSRRGSGRSNEPDNAYGRHGSRGRGFMGMRWDATGVAFDPATWEAALRVLRPGGHLLAFGGSRTYHRVAVAIEDAGFEIRDSIMWLYGQGFPKNLDVGRAMDVEGRKPGDFRRREARAWEGRGTALKPGHEPIVVARKALDGTVVETALRHGTGPLHLDPCRIVGPKGDGRWGSSNEGSERPGGRRAFNASPTDAEYRSEQHEGGRWPSNVAMDEEAAAELDEQTGEMKGGAFPARRGAPKFGHRVYNAWSGVETEERRMDGGGASRFYFVAKADRAERDAGCEEFDKRPINWSSGDQSPGTFQAEGTEREARNAHPTVKPIDLMRWLVRLVAPPGGLVLDPFCGSGTTGVACALEDLEFLGFEADTEAGYADVARARIAWWERFEPGTDTEAALRSAARERARRDAGQLDLTEAV